jgi:cyclomaltodextrinase
MEEKHLFLHYKGKLYTKIGHATHTETGEKLVVYRDQDGKIWCRPFDMFYEMVEINGKSVPRFKYLGRF